MKHLKTLIAIAIASTLTLPLLADMKGGEKLITLNAPAARIENAVPTAKMSCPEVTRTRIDQTARGAVKPVTVYTVHQCASCKTTEVSTGVGKQATHAMQHSCNTAATCCKSN